jgi:L-seryl-tRNA(Ser) seleniumtransferase
VTTGAASALLLATASCVTGLDIIKMERLPDTSGMKNEVVIARHHRNAYDHMIRAVGVKLVEAGLHERGVGVGSRTVEIWEYEAAITDKTAAVAYFARPGNTPPLEDVVKVARSHGLPVIVDAAAELPPAANLRRFIAQGASAVTFSGGKAIRGPQASGILCGSREIVMGAVLQQLDMDCRFELWNPPPSLIDKSLLRGIPRHGIGRGFKAGKEEIVGLITALELYAQKDEAEERRQYESKVRAVVEGLKGVEGIDASLLPSSATSPTPMAQVLFTAARGQEYMTRIDRYLKSKDPPVYLDDSRVDDMIFQVNPFNLKEEDVHTIIGRIKEAAESV